MSKSIEEATAGLIEAIRETDTDELLALAALLAEASEDASETRGRRERVFAAFGPLLGAVLVERHPRPKPGDDNYADWEFAQAIAGYYDEESE